MSNNRDYAVAFFMQGDFEAYRATVTAEEDAFRRKFGRCASVEYVIPEGAFSLRDSSDLHHLMQDERIARQIIRNKRHAILHAHVLEPANDTQRVGLNSVVTIQLETMDMGKPFGEPKTIRVASYQMSDPSANPPLLSHDSQLIAGIMGKTIAEVEEDPPIVEIQGVRYYVYLEKIELRPMSVPTTRAVA